ncbi:ubiquinol-cytochrome C chaperone family protein [Litorimonas sp. RW-G-Af-16]
MGLFAKLFGGKTSVNKDAERLYNALMKQSRLPQFYGKDQVPDNFDGRIDVLTFHIAPVLKALNGHGENGHLLGQALFDQMKDDFEIALREEGISDTGVKKRIKPMISLFYARVKVYTEALLGDTPKSVLTTSLQGFHPDQMSETFAERYADYMIQFSTALERKSLGEIALVDFTFPDL